MPKVNRIYLKTITVLNKYKYKLYAVDAGNLFWIDADPVYKGVRRSADTEAELLIILENDCMNIEKQEKAMQRVRG